MNTSNLVKKQPAAPTVQPTGGLRVRTDLRAGAWNCKDCQGQVNGNTLFQPKCSYCQLV